MSILTFSCRDRYETSPTLRVAGLSARYDYLSCECAGLSSRHDYLLCECVSISGSVVVINVRRAAYFLTLDLQDGKNVSSRVMRA